MGSGYAGFVLSMTLLFVFLCPFGCEHETGKEKAALQSSDSVQQSVDIVSAMQGAKLLDEALNAQFGLERIQTAQQWTARSRGTYMGMAYSGITTFDGDAMRMDIAMPDGRQMSFVMGGKYCWTKVGPVVTMCSEEERNGYKEQFMWENAARLYPLKQEGWVVKNDTTKTEGKAYPTLVISHRGTTGEGRLIFGPRSKLLVEARLPMMFNGKKGRMITQMLDYQHECGIMMPYHTISTFEGKRVMEDKVDEYYCDSVKPDLFPEPLQVADGTFLQRATSSDNVFCLKVQGRGTYSDVGPNRDKLMNEVAARSLAPIGPMFVAYLVPPALASKKRKSETKLCVPVSASAPEEPKEQGDYVLEAWPGRKVLSVFAVGDYSKQFDRMVGLLSKEVKSQKLKITGPMVQVFHHDPSIVAAKDLVSEMQVPIR